MRRLVIHIGDCKTGSTSIQEALVKRAYRGVDGPVHFPAAKNHIPVARALGAGDASPLRELVAQAGEGTTILSAEHFEFVDPARLAEALAPVWQDDVTVVGYVRPHAEALFARYCENVKIGNMRGDSWAFHKRMLRRGRLEYATRFGAWRSVFGSNFILRLFAPEAFAGGDVVSDFLSTIFGAEAHAQAKLHYNRALTAEALALHRIIFDVLGCEAESQGARTAFGRNLARVMQDLGETQMRMDKKLARAVKRVYLEDACATDAMFFLGNPLERHLVRSELNACEVPLSLKATDYFDADTINAVIAMARTIEPLFFDRPGVVSQVLRDNYLAGRPSEARIDARKKALTSGD